jgi:hypothetical protein
LPRVRSTARRQEEPGLSLEQAFAVFGGLATVAGLALAVYYGRREGRKRKILTYEASVAPWPVASSASLAEYNLSLAYEREGEEPRRIADAYAHFVRFANLGHEPIRHEDIAGGNPLRIDVAGDVEVLDASLEAVTRDVARIELGQIEPRKGSTSVPITFDFLDYQDGALVRLMTTSPPEAVALAGDIIGMPEGIRAASEVTARRTFWGPLGFILFVLFEVFAFSAVALAYRLVTEDWSSLWLLPLPILALFGPLIIAFIVSETIWPKQRPDFPRPLRYRGPAFLSEDIAMEFAVFTNVRHDMERRRLDAARAARASRPQEEEPGGR